MLLMFKILMSHFFLASFFPSKLMCSQCFFGELNNSVISVLLKNESHQESVEESPKTYTQF